MKLHLTKNCLHGFFGISILGLLALSACKSEKPTVATDIVSEVLSDAGTVVIIPGLNDLMGKAELMDNAIQILVATPNESNLIAAQQAWYAARNSWEVTEAFLFGPVATLQLDPAIDDWPVNYIELDSVLASSAAFTDDYIKGLNTTLKGFHPIEYMIFGFGGNRKATELTPRMLQYIQALSKSLKEITKQMHQEWIAGGGNYISNLTLAGKNGSIYKSRNQAFLEIVNAMIGIIDEVGEGKIGEPFNAQDSMLEESPFSGNSWKDFSNNLMGAKNVYTCTYVGTGKSIRNWLDDNNRSLNQKLTQKFDACIANLQSYQIRFGKAIYTQPTAIASTQQQLNDLKSILEAELIPLINVKVLD
jgi:predicted lipoprotein